MYANGENTQSASPGASAASQISTAWRPQIGCFRSGSTSNQGIIIDEDFP